MASVFRKSYTRAMPPDSELFERKGERFARWRDYRGKPKTAKVTTDNGGSEQIIVESRIFTAKYRDGSGIVRERTTGCRTKDGAQAVLAGFIRRAEKVGSGILTTAEDAVADHQAAPLSEHFDAYLMHLRAKGASDKHRENVKRQLKRLADDCHYRRLGELDRETLECWLVERTAEDMSARTRNTYLAAITGFGNWCRRNGRLVANPFGGVAKADERADRKRERRALTANELRRLLDVTRRRPLLDATTIRRGKRKGQAVGKLREATRQRLDTLGRERALIYKTLVLTGLRRGELQSLTFGQLDLSGPVAYAVLHAADEKNREGSEIPIRADLASDLSDLGIRPSGIA